MTAAPLLAADPRHEEADSAPVGPGYWRRLVREFKSQAAARQSSKGQELSRTAAVVTSLAAGACAGALAKTTIAPLDRTKIHFQSSETPYSVRAAFEFLKQSARADGLTALWRGNSATMARIIPYAAIQFTAHEQWKRALGVDTPAMAKQHKVRHLVAGSLAGVTSQSATYPLDLARARMAVTSAATYPSLAAVFRKVATQEGLRTLYRGYPATVLGVVPYAGVSFFTYDTLKRHYFEYSGKQQSSVLNVVFGGAAGALGQTASYPLDIVRRRMQTAPRRADGSYPYRNIPGAIQHVYRPRPDAPTAATPTGTYPAPYNTCTGEHTAPRLLPAGYSAPAHADRAQAPRRQLPLQEHTRRHTTRVQVSTLHPASYPLDIVRRRMQTAPRRADGSYPYRNIPGAIQHVYRAEGWRGFFKGLSMNWVKGPVAVGISFATYDKIKTTLRDLALTLQ